MVKRVAQAWAFASILLLPNYADLTSGAGDARMRSPVALTGVALAQLTDMALVALLLFRVDGSTAPGSRLAEDSMGTDGGFTGAPVCAESGCDAVGCASCCGGGGGHCVGGSAGIPRGEVSQIAGKVSRGGSSLLAGFAVFAVVMTAQLGRASLWRPGPQSFTSPIAAAGPSRPRLVWILFDELAYRPTFEARDAGLQLPSFDRLRAESTLYSAMTPVAYRTTRVVPSLLLGKAVTDVTYTANNEYLVQVEGDAHWQMLDANATLFGMAKQHGLTSSIVGWYIAYCPVLVGVATNCYWANEDAQDRGPTSTSASFLENVWFPLRILAEQAVAPRWAWRGCAAWNALGHEAAVKDIEEHALSTVDNSQADIIYLHLPAPHPPAVWDRRTGTYGLGGSYLDSLDYSDRLLGKIMNVLEGQPRWAETTLIVQGDHSWRTDMWRPLPGWSAEDERISHGGKWDPRPLLLIHAAGQRSTETVTAPTSIMYVHDRVESEIEAMAKGR
jgi:hypothetical protein